MAERIPTTAIWGDGAGSTFRATVDAIHESEVNFEVRGVITTDPEAGILDQVAFANKEYGMDIEPFVVEGRPGRRQSEEVQEDILGFLEKNGTRSLTLMGALVIMGETIVNELNGDVPEEELPKTLEGARELMVPADDGFSTYLPDDFPGVQVDTGRYGLTNTHPAPTIVTANTHGLGSQKRMIQLHSRESAHTYHAVAKGVDTGPIIAAHIFRTETVAPGADEKTVEKAAKLLFATVQDVEKRELPRDVEMQLYRRKKHFKDLKKSPRQ